MTSKNTPRSKSQHAAKKAIVLNSNKKNRSLLVAIATVATMIVIGFALWGAMDSPSGPSNSQVTENQTVTDGLVTYAVSDFADGKARHFQYTHGKYTIKYFMLKSADGVIRAAFDACDVCWPAGKGYYQDGDMMVCRNCGQRFASIQVNEVSGGCNPAPLTREIQGDKVVLRTKDILAGKPYFNFN